MKFLSLVYLASGIAASVVRRDLATITSVLNDVGTDLDGLNTAAKNFNGDPNELLDASNKAVQGIKDGDAKIQPLPELSLNDALGLTGPAKDLQTKGDALLASIKGSKDAIAKADLCEVTLLQVSDLKTASDALIKSVVSKVPAAAQSIAQGLVAPLQQALADAKDLFSSANCQNSGGGGGGSSSQPTSAPTSTAPPATTSTGAPATTTTDAPATTTTEPPVTTSVPTVPATTPTATIPITTPGPGNETCPAASTVTVTATDTKDCTPTPTCTKTPPVTITTTKKACPTGSKLPW
ncbi:cell wall galactomannoprotein Mp2/allergen F17-like protein [Beauveria brongniartii RCEF 3172]|uniref:Cell wall galactomannoprotein Mp2/allergen F17-like protein n=1 Tax=Beauveria brongniartii RCEF 3172 TaxID=1081107 RepID=A0A167K0L4_9HYPO|nr:cell wall galactomannoprotein Mp2/allergen F17-like protein [Beauveria brongniartii RCEF 3172]